MKTFVAASALLAMLAFASPALAQPAALNMTEQLRPKAPAVLPLREQARLRDAWLEERLDTIIPMIMREQGVDMWVLVAREYFEEPVVATMLDAESMHARRRTILVFFDPGGGRPVERFTVSRYGLGGLFAPAWEPEKQRDQWKRLAEIIAERDPKRIAINSSALTAFADGMTLSQYAEFTEALPRKYRGRVESNQTLAVRWLETRTPAEMAVYPSIVRLAHSIIAEAFSDAVIRPGKTTAADVVWWMREKVSRLGLKVWFQPSVAIIRQGAAEMLEGDAVIRPGDMLWTDFGITYLGLNTDTQHLGYVLKRGERDVPAGLKAGLAANNRVRDALTSSFRAGDSGNAILARARAKAIAEGLKASIYSHPIGLHGHGAGPAIGFWDNQEGDPRGADLVRPNTAWSIELAAKLRVPEWGGQEVEFRSEDDAYFDGTAVRYLDGRQDRFHIIRGR